MMYEVICVAYSILELLIVLSIVGPESPFLLCEENKLVYVKSEDFLTGLQ